METFDDASKFEGLSNGAELVDEEDGSGKGGNLTGGETAFCSENEFSKVSSASIRKELQSKQNSVVRQIADVISVKLR